MTPTLFVALPLAAVAAVLLSLVREIRALRTQVAVLGEAQRRSAALTAEENAAVLREALARAAAIERATLPDPYDSDPDLDDEVTRIISPPRVEPANDAPTHDTPAPRSATDEESPRSTLLPPPKDKSG